MIDIIVAGTGHRNLKNTEITIYYEIHTFFEQLIQNLNRKYKRGNFRIKVIQGVAIGFDTLLAFATIKLREKYPDIFVLESAIPTKNQSKEFNEIQKMDYQYILKHSDIVTEVFKDKKYGIPKYEDSYNYKQMFKRNYYMVDQSNFVLAYYHGGRSGTLNAINRAKLKNKEIVYLNV